MGTRSEPRGALRHNQSSTTDRPKVLSAGQKVALIALIVAVLAGVLVARDVALVALSVTFTVFFATANLMKLYLIRRGANDPRTLSMSSDIPVRSLDDQLPMYTILLPLYREVAILRQLIDGVRALDYPRAKLDVKLLLEEDDVTTREAVTNLALPPCFEAVIVSGDGPKGKPRARTPGLARAKGDYLVIYDAEDRPERDQLRKSVAAFMSSAPDVVCLQAKLNYFNRTQNLLTRWFTAEYSLWFDQLLPGLQVMDV